MKIYTKYPSGITKIIKEKEFYQTEDLSNTITVYVDRTNLTDITYTLTLEFLRADGRKTSLVATPFVAGEETTLEEDDITYDIHNFVLTETQLAVAGALAFTCYITIVNNNVITSRGALFNAINNVRKTVAYPGNTIFVVDDEEDVPVIVADMKNAIDNLNGQVAGITNDVKSIQALENLDNIVGTDAELESLITIGETTEYQLNAKVQVLNDSSHDGNSTLYNLEELDIEDGIVDNYSWRFVGYYDGYNKEQIDEIITDFEQSVNDNFSELSEQLGAALATQDEKIEELGQLQPSGADTSTNILAKETADGIWIGTDTGHWYYWDGTQYVDGGTFQATEIEDGSVTPDKIAKTVTKTQSLLNLGTVTANAYIYGYDSNNKISILISANAPTNVVEYEITDKDKYITLTLLESSYYWGGVIGLATSDDTYISHLTYSRVTDGTVSFLNYDSSTNVLTINVSDLLSANPTCKKIYIEYRNTDVLLNGNVIYNITDFEWLNNDYENDTDNIKDNAVTTSKIQNNTISSDKIIDESITSIKIDKSTFNNLEYVDPYNLFDVDNAINTTPNGQPCIANNELIKVNAGDILYYYANNDTDSPYLAQFAFYQIHYYDYNKNYVGASGYFQNSVTIPSGIYYIRCHLAQTNYKHYQITKNQYSTLWRPYHTPYYRLKDRVINTFDITMFNNIGFIGDSYTEGYAQNSQGVMKNDIKHTYPYIMCNKYGIDYTNFGVSGANTRTYITNSRGLPTVLNENAKDCYFMALGINDYTLIYNDRTYLGSISDIDDNDYTQNADTFYGNYGKIIQQVLQHAPNSKICMIGFLINKNDNIQINIHNAIKEIAEHFNIVFLDTMKDDFFLNSYLVNNLQDGHPTYMGYTGLAKAIERMFSQAVADNLTYFKFSAMED